MLGIKISIFLGLIAYTSASLSGPFLFWGHEGVKHLQPNALVEATNKDFTLLYKSAKAIAIFVRNNSYPLKKEKYTEFQNLVQNGPWVYLPQHSLVDEPFNFNTNIEVINLNGESENDDKTIVANYKESVAVYGEGEVLGILASREYSSHRLSKREAKKTESETEEESESTTPSSPITDETEKSFIYVADGNKAVLYVNTAPQINLNNTNGTIKLVEHHKAITFDDLKQKGFGRFTVIFNVEGEKLFLRFNFTLSKGSWFMKAVEVEYKKYKTILPLSGTQYNVPSAPVGFSYRCNSRPMLFINGSDSLVIHDFQVQPWLSKAEKFGDVYYCVGFFSTAILSGAVVTIFLGMILTFGLIMLMDIKPPTRFESTRSKQLTIDLQE